jgi:F-type H+-transporting ATPase subunit gamma
MKNLRELKKRIGSINKTKEITNAMKIIASIRLRNAQRALYDMRPYSDRLLSMIQRLLTHDTFMQHPLFLDRREEINKVIILVFTADRGLCGAYNSNIIRYTEEYINRIDDIKDYSLITIGKKGAKYFTRGGYKVLEEYSGFRAEVEFANAQDVGQLIIDAYLGEEVGEVYAIYNKYLSSGQQKAVVESVLPLKELQLETPLASVEYLYEPTKESILNALLPLYINVKAWRLLQESSASEHASRMVAMENASDNCKELLGNITLQYNKARQASITAELLEVVGTVEALKGGN